MWHRGTAPRWRRRGARGRASSRGRCRPGAVCGRCGAALPFGRRGEGFAPGRRSLLRLPLGCGRQGSAGDLQPSPAQEAARLPVCINSVICSPAESRRPVLIGDKWGWEKRGKGRMRVTITRLHARLGSLCARLCGAAGPLCGGWRNE